MPIPPSLHPRLRAADPAAPRRTDVMSAGRALVLIVLTLVLAAVFNSGRQAERASQRPLGADRDRALAVWEPIDAVAGPLGLQAPRSLFDTIRDGGESSDDGESVIDVAATAPGTTTGTVPEIDEPSASPATTIPATTTMATTPPPRTVTAEDPLRVALLGDSTMTELGAALQKALAATGVARSEVDARISSGLSRPDFFDWPAHVVQVLPEQDPEVIITIFGGNDAQGFVVDGAVLDFGTPEWITEYRRRVSTMMTLMSDAGRKVIWIGQPTMRSESFDAKIAVLNQIYADQAATFERVEFVDSKPFISPAGYRAYGPGVDGTDVQLRAIDGIHLTREGGAVIAVPVLEILRSEGFLPAGP